ncbi:MAG: hypothetical protein HY582_03645 [Candidatus Omnitrophica bacterium]|nr:hypothetical protein [Candidatus Omnitrophota bacterium]
MKKNLLNIGCLLIMVVLVFPGCSSTSQARNFNGLSTPDGGATHISTSNVALHLLFGTGAGIAGDASLEKTVSDFTEAAKAEGASKVRIVQSSRRAWWFVFPPFSFFITPVTSNVAGDAIK